MVLWDLKLVIEFPPGVTILIPSAVFCHGNTMISNGKKRYLFAQYSAGGLFRWVDHGYQLDEAYYNSLTMAEQRAKEKATWETRWKRGLAMFSTLAQLRRLYSTATSTEWATCAIGELSDLSDKSD